MMKKNIFILTTVMLLMAIMSCQSVHKAQKPMEKND